MNRKFFVVKMAQGDYKQLMYDLIFLCILDTPFEERFDPITRTAIRLFRAPVAFMRSMGLQTIQIQKLRPTPSGRKTMIVEAL